MKRVGRGLIRTIAAVSFMCAMLTQNVWAAGSVSITATSEAVEVGGEVSVTIKAENPEGSAEKPEISVKYDAAVLTFDSCDKETGGGGGGLITLADTEATIKFKGAASGTTDVEVSAILDGDGANVPTDKVTIAVGDGVGTAAEGTDAAGTTSNIADGLIAINGTEKMISTTFPNEILPAGFHKADFTYQEQLLESAQFDMGDLTLLYVTDASGANGEFCIYDAATDTFTDFVNINGIESRFIVIMIPDETVVVPDGFTKATLQWNGKTLTAYAITGDAATAAATDPVEGAEGAEAAGAEAEGTSEVTANGISTSDFFLLYALNSDGNKGWYLYDMKEGTYQRYLELDAEGAEEPSVLDVFDSDTDSYKAQSHTRFIIICVMAVVMLVLVILLLNLFLKLREYQSYEYIDEDEEDEEDEDERDFRSHRGGGRSLRDPDPLSAEELRARRYEAGEDLEETGEIDLGLLSQRPVQPRNPMQQPQQVMPASPVGYETQDMVFEDISLPDPALEDEEDEEEEEERYSRKKKAKKEKKKSRFAKWYEDDDFGDDDDDEDDEDDEDMEDDEEDDDEDDYREHRSIFGRKKKKAPEPVEATQLDWSEMQSAMQTADEDERRPMTGTRRPVTSPRMIVTEPPTPAPARTVHAPEAVVPTKPTVEEAYQEEFVEPPKPVKPKYEQPVPQKAPVQPRYEQPMQQPVQQPRYEQPVQQPRYEQPVQQPRYEQPMQQPVQQPHYGQQAGQQYYEQPVQQQYYEQPVQQQYYEQPMQQQLSYEQQQYYDQQMQQQQQQQRMMQQPVQQPKLDLDDDFEFEFINVDK